MKDFAITAKVPAKKDETGEEVTQAMAATVIVQTAETLEEASQAFGEAACLTNMDANWRVTLQGNIRSALRKGESPEAIAERLSTAKMGVASIGASIDPQAAFIAKFKTSTEEQQAEMLEQLREAAAQG